MPGATHPACQVRTAELDQRARQVVDPMQRQMRHDQIVCLRLEPKIFVFDQQRNTARDRRHAG
jgi:hypothetical protein